MEVIDFFGRILNFCRFLRGLGDFLPAFLQSAESNNLGVFLWASSLSLSLYISINQNQNPIPCAFALKIAEADPSKSGSKILGLLFVLSVFALKVLRPVEISIHVF